MKKAGGQKTEAGCRMSVMWRLSSYFCQLSAVLCLLSCTAIHPPEPYLPPRTGMVPGETIRVKGNENIYGIAQSRGVSMRDIIVLNGLQPPFALKPGQSLILPFRHGDAVSAGVSAAPSALPGFTPAAAAGSIEQAPLAPVQTEVLPPPQPAAPIQTAPPVMPFAKAQPMQAPVAVAPVEALNAPPPPLKPVPTTLASVAAASMSITAAPAADTGSGPPAMIWPVQGPVLSGYGPKGQGVNNDGVNIGAPKGAPVVAAAPGIVVYAGNEMKGFGNLVLIRHQGGWVTAYAYLDRMLVNKDAVVAQGDEIGTVGKTGTIATPQLHFEVRQGGKAVDPARVVKGNQGNAHKFLTID